MSVFRRFVFIAAIGTAACAAQAQEVTLKVHHFLGPQSTQHVDMFGAWCDKLAKESANKLKCQIYPSMQLGGSPPQLYDQARDGVADIVWTVAGYSAGRFPKIEVFELPFMMTNAEATSRAAWEYYDKYDRDEFKDTHILAVHVHGPGNIYTVNKPIKTLADFKGLKLRAPTRLTNKMLAMLGATPVGMPVPAVPEALSKGVIDGAVIPYEVAPGIKVNELTKYTAEPDRQFNALVHHGVPGGDEQGQVRIAAAGPEEGARRQFGRRLLGLHGQDPGGRRRAGQGEDDRLGQPDHGDSGRRTRQVEEGHRRSSTTSGSPTSRPRAATARCCCSRPAI